MPAMRPAGRVTTTCARCPRRASARPSASADCSPTWTTPPDLFITSPRLRASQTAEIVAKALGKRGRRGRTPGRAARRERRGPRPRVARPALWGRASSVTTRTSRSCSASSSVLDAIPMRKGAIARVDVEGPEIVAGTGSAPLPAAAGPLSSLLCLGLALLPAPAHRVRGGGEPGSTTWGVPVDRIRWPALGLDADRELGFRVDDPPCAGGGRPSRRRRPGQLSTGSRVGRP